MPPDAERHRAALRDLRDRVVERARRDHRFLAVALGGSSLGEQTDAYSDLDVVLIVADDAFDEVMAERRAFAEGLGGLLTAFTAEHVGEPRMLICLFGPPERLVHCDLKLVSASQSARRVEDAAIAWEREPGLVGRLHEGTPAVYPQPDRQWLEDRFWVWVHYAATKLGRGELYEVLDVLAYLRSAVLGPLLLSQAGLQPTGVRRLEQLAPQAAARLEATVCGHDAAACARALRAAAVLYDELRDERIVQRPAAREAALGYLAEISAQDA